MVCDFDGGKNCETSDALLGRPTPARLAQLTELDVPESIIIAKRTQLAQHVSDVFAIHHAITVSI